MAKDTNDPYSTYPVGSGVVRPGDDGRYVNQLNGIVEGTEKNDVIDLNYTGDPQGDRIDGGDAINPGHGADDDVVDGDAGDDFIEAMRGNDTVYAGSGDDTALGGIGNDVLYGDDNAPGGAGGTAREVFKWDLAPDPDNGGGIDDGDDLSDGFTQNTGNVTVTYSVLHEDPGVDTEFTTQDQRVAEIDTGGTFADKDSGLWSVLNGKTNTATYELGFSASVSNVSFRVNDIDGDGQVRIQAFDLDGKPISVNISGGQNLVETDEDSVRGDETATGLGGYADPNSAKYSLLVTVPGPVARLTVQHGQDGPNASGITITDVFFDVAVLDNGADGNDSLIGGDGDDTLFGEGGSDTLIGGGDSDSIEGGDGSDSVDGGDGDDVIDTSGSVPLPDRGFDGFGVIPAIPADADPFDDRDTVDGGTGHDYIATGDDTDLISGGQGKDTIDSGLDDDTITGDGGADFIVGGEGSDRIDAGDGADIVYGGLNPAFPDALNIRDYLGDPAQDNGRDTIDGGAGNDTIFGQDDHDVIDGGDGNDLIDGGIDDDLLIGGAGDDTIDGGEGQDLLLGTEGSDLLRGGDDNDVLGANIGDTLQGGEGGVVDFDTLIAARLATVSYDPADPTGESGTVTFYHPDLSVAGTADFSEIERVFAIDLGGRDVTPAPTGLPDRSFTENVVEGTDQDDEIDLDYLGDPEGDRIDNNDAQLPLVPGSDQDVVTAGAGDDLVLSGAQSDLVFGGSGDDTLFGQGGSDGLSGGSGDDFLDGGDGRDLLVGGAGDDTLVGNNGNPEDGGDLLFGNTGDDLFVDISQGETVVGGEDADDGDIDVLDLTGAAEAANPGGSLSVEYSDTDPEAGIVRFYDENRVETGTAEFKEIEVVMPCFTPGTLIATPKGERRVEELQVGDRVITRDNGIQAIRWVGKRMLSADDVDRARHLSPVLIREGALGGGLPERDMIVSPNHRVLVANDKTALYFEEREVLVAAKHLVGLDGVENLKSAEVTYIHFMFDQHEVVLSDGAWTESFQPGDHSLAGLGNAQRNEIFELFPELKTKEGLEQYPSARRSLKKHEARLLM